MSGFLARWSRRKRGEDGSEPGAADAVAEPAPPPLVPEPSPVALPAAEAALVPAPDPAGDPDAPPPSLEDLARNGDLRPFLRPGIAPSLRRAALRQAWSLDPAIRDFVGPADYAWDFNAPDGVPGFALDLGGDLRQLIAQAIGVPPDPPAAAPDAAPTGEAAEPEPGSGSLAAAPGQPVLPAAGDQPTGHAPPAGATFAEPERGDAGTGDPRIVADLAGEAAAAPAEPAPASPRPRRHGGAVPG